MPVTQKQIEEWRDGPAGFFKWVEAVKPRILKQNNKYEPIELADWQKREITPLLEKLPSGECVNQTCCITWPRRHGKSYMNVLIALHRFTCYENQNIKVLANSSRQAIGTNFKLLKNIILNTPALLSLIGQRNLQGVKIKGGNQSEIEAVPNNANVLYGEKVNLVLTTELHASKDAEALGVLTSSVGDSIDGQLLIDSTTDGPNGPIAALEQLQENGEAGIYVTRIEYKDLQDVLRNAPAWIRRSWIENQHKTQLPAFFGTQILNRRADALNTLFRLADVQAAMAEIRNPVDPGLVDGLFSGRKYIVGGGLDRAYGFSLNGDNTIWTTVAKVAGADDEPHYWVLNQKDIAFSSGGSIKKAIAGDNESYGLLNVVIERYNAQDIWAWCGDAKIHAEIVHGNTNEQISVFTELHRIVSERRLHFSRDLKQLEAELTAFTVDNTGTAPRFEAAKGFHDDRVYSLAWAIWATRQEELTTYELPRVVCQSRSQHAQYCYLRNGEVILPCARECEAHRRVERWHVQYNQKAVGDEMTLPEFYKTKVRLKGVKVYQGV
ncbi:MAG: hypothetical protein H0S80_05075 [Desulfovibrionaceae bacterium]|nr:hypothetical protein [Desulfovibrionaceae bacterium]